MHLFKYGACTTTRLRNNHKSNIQQAPHLDAGRLAARVQDVPLGVHHQLQQRARPREQRRQERGQVRSQARRVRFLRRHRV